MFREDCLSMVAMEIRFPAILKINSESPAKFQECIRGKYPFYEEKRQNMNTVSISLGESPFNQPQANLRTNMVYIFSTKDKKSRIHLSGTNIKFECVSSEDWDKKFSLWVECLAQFVAVYKPAFYERGSFRYLYCWSTVDADILRKDIKDEWLGLLRLKERMRRQWFSAEFYQDEKDMITAVNLGLGQMRREPGLKYIIDIISTKNKMIDVSEDEKWMLSLQKYNEETAKLMIKERG